jgi:hypothetical protein
MSMFTILSLIAQTIKRDRWYDEEENEMQYGVPETSMWERELTEGCWWEIHWHPEVGWFVQAIPEPNVLLNGFPITPAMLERRLEEEEYLYREFNRNNKKES